MRILKRLNAAGKRRIDNAFLMNNTSRIPEESKYIDDIERRIDISGLDTIIDDCLQKYEPFDESIDAFLAPLLHEHLSLNAREAGDEGTWFYLTCCAYPELVRHRWKPGKTGLISSERFLSPLRRNTFYRLWWIAEHSVKGRDYSLTEKAIALHSQDFFQQLFERKFSWSYDSIAAVVNVLGSEKREIYRPVEKMMTQVLTTAIFETLDQKAFEQLLKEFVQSAKSK